MLIKYGLGNEIIWSKTLETLALFFWFLCGTRDPSSVSQSKLAKVWKDVSFLLSQDSEQCLKSSVNICWPFDLFSDQGIFLTNHKTDQKCTL